MHQNTAVQLPPFGPLKQAWPSVFSKQSAKTTAIQSSKCNEMISQERCTQKSQQVLNKIPRKNIVKMPKANNQYKHGGLPFDLLHHPPPPVPPSSIQAHPSCRLYGELSQLCSILLLQGCSCCSVSLILHTAHGCLHLLCRQACIAAAPCCCCWGCLSLVRT